MIATETRWATATAESPCPKCEKTDRCRIAPDGTAGICWRSGASEIWRNGHHNGNGQHHAPDLKPPKTKATYVSDQAAIEAAGKYIAGGKLTQVYVYGDASRVARFDLADGSKQFRPVHRLENGWAVGDPAGLWPLYRGDELPVTGLVYIVEGEKAADCAWSIGLAGVTSAHGSSAAAKTDWAPLAGRDCIILPDNDKPGEKYAMDVAAILASLDPPARAKIVRLPGLPVGGDIVEFDAGIGDTPEACKAAIEQLAEQIPWEKADVLAAMSASKMLADFPELKRPLIEGILRETETCNIIAAAKVGKTHIAIDLALSVRTGRAWLNKYAIVNPGPVLYIDCELHQNTLSRRIASICSARGIFKDEISDGFDVLSLRGRLRDIFSLRSWFSTNAKGYHLIILDALYRLIPEGIDENSNSDMTRVFNALDQIAEMTGAAIMVVHHASKGSQGGKSVVDVGAGAGAMARATDTHLILRQHEEDNCIVMDMAARSWPPIQPACLRWQYPTWNIDATLNPDDLRQEGRRKKKADADDATPTPEPWTVDRFISAFTSDIRQDKPTILARATNDGLSQRQAESFVRLAMNDRKLFRWSYPKDRTIYLARKEQTLIEASNA